MLGALRFVRVCSAHACWRVLVCAWVCLDVLGCAWVSGCVLCVREFLSALVSAGACCACGVCWDVLCLRACTCSVWRFSSSLEFRVEGLRNLEQQKAAGYPVLPCAAFARQVGMCSVSSGFGFRVWCYESSLDSTLWHCTAVGNTKSIAQAMHCKHCL